MIHPGDARHQPGSGRVSRLPGGQRVRFSTFARFTMGAAERMVGLFNDGTPRLRGWRDGCRGDHPASAPRTPSETASVTSHDF